MMNNLPELLSALLYSWGGVAVLCALGFGWVWWEVRRKQARAELGSAERAGDQ